MLQETADELLGGELELAPLLILTIFIFEGDGSVLILEDALGTQGGAIDVGREVFQCGLSIAGGLDIDDPVL